MSKLRDLARDFQGGARIKQLRDKYNLSDRVLLKTVLAARRWELVSDAALSRLVIERTQYDFPEEPETRLATLLGCLNSELKHVILLGLDMYPKTYTDIARSLESLTSAKLPAPPAFSCYCEDSFMPAGLVVRMLLGRRRGFAVRHFAISEAGERYGQPMAAYSLRYAVDHGISLYELLGQTQSVGHSRAPYNRARIAELVSEGHDQIVDLTNRLGLTLEDVRQHLQKLKKLGVLDFESLTFDRRGIKLYHWVERKSLKEVRSVGELQKLTLEVAKWLHDNKQGDRNQIAHELNYRHPTHVSRVLSGLQQQGLAHTPFPAHRKSRVVLAERAGLLTDYVKALRNALEEGSELRRMRAIFEEFLRDSKTLQRYADAGIELYRGVSPAIRAKPSAERETEMLQFMKAFEERERVGPRPVDLVAGLAWTHGSVTRHVRMLLNRRLILRAKKGTVARYSVRQGQG